MRLQPAAWLPYPSVLQLPAAVQAAAQPLSAVLPLPEQPIRLQPNDSGRSCIGLTAGGILQLPSPSCGRTWAQAGIQYAVSGSGMAPKEI